MKNITPTEYKIWLASVQNRTSGFISPKRPCLGIGSNLVKQNYENPIVVYDKCHELEDVPFLLFRLSIADGMEDLTLSYKDPKVLKSVIFALQRIASKHKIPEGEIKARIVAALI